VDYSHESLNKDGIYLNKVMLNQFDNCRTFDFEPESLYNQNNRGIIRNLLWVKFDSSKVKQEVVLVDCIEKLFEEYGLNFHAYRDSKFSCIVQFEELPERMKVE